jgi:predicted RND superfamily exporter protein
VFFAWLSEWFGRRRWLVALFVAAMTVWALAGISRLQFDDVPRSVFQSESDEFVWLNRLFADFGSDDNDCLIVVESGELFSPAGVAELRELVRAVRTLPGIESVRGLTDVAVFSPDRPAHSLLPAAGAAPGAFRQAKREALANPLLVGQVLSPDAQTTLILARMQGDSISVNEVDAVLAPLREQIAKAQSRLPGSRIRLTGVPPIRSEIFAAVKRDGRRFVLIGVVLAIAMAAALFRRFWAVVIVAGAPITSALWLMGTMGWFGAKLNVINTILPTLVMVVGFTDAVHLMVDIRHSIGCGVPPLTAAKLAIRHLGPACFMTSFTTAIGFFSLIVADVGVISRFGVQCAAGAALAFIGVMTIVPLLSSSPIGSRLQVPSGFDPLAWHVGQSTRFIDWILDRPRLITSLGVTLTIVLALGCLRLYPDHQLTESIPDSNESVQAARHLNRALGGTMTVFVLAEWQDNLSLASPEVLQTLVDVQSRVSEIPEVHYPLSLVDLLFTLPAQGDLHSKLKLLPLVPADILRRFVRPESRRAMISLRLDDRGTAAHQATFAALESALAKLEQQHPGVRLKLTGTAVVASRNILLMISDLIESLAMAGVIIFISMALLFRSLRLGLIAILPNMFPLAVAGTVLWATGHYLQLTSVIVFSVSLGIAVDDTIHFVNRFQREMEVDGNVRASIERAFAAVGAALISTSLILIVGFGSVFLRRYFKTSIE